MRKLAAALGIAFAELRHRRLRAFLGVLGIAIAVVAAVLLLSLGFSILETGDAGFTRIGGDLWITAGPTTFATEAVGGIDASILGAHEVAADIAQHEDVTDARALAFQSVYVGTSQGDYETIVGAGISGDGEAFQTEAGRSFRTGDRHYANGSYDGPMTNEALVDRRAAEQLGIEVGDTIHVGGTLAAADNNEFEVVGISNDIARYLGAPTVMLHLGELQRVSSKTGTDPATTVLVDVDDDADPQAVQRDLQTDYEEYEVRTNQEQFEAVLERQSTVIAGAFTIIILAVAGGIAIVTNVMGMFVYQQRETLAALRAIGVSSGTLFRIVVAQGVSIAAVGAALGVAITIPSVRALNYVVEAVIGHEDLVVAPTWALAAGGSLALLMGLCGAVAAGWLVLRVAPLEHLEQ